MKTQKTLFESWGGNTKRDPTSNHSQGNNNKEPVPSTSSGNIPLNNADNPVIIISDEDELDNGSDDEMLANVMDMTIQEFHEEKLRQKTLLNYRDRFTVESRKHEQTPLEDLPGFDLDTGKVWIYPTNYPIRQYQFDIVKSSLFQNTLVCLPTGLGKTFIAAVLMYNMYRWYPQGKIVFLAPTRPLVAQQIEACYNTMGIRMADIVEFTGSLSPETRVKLWREHRLFFMTPQVMQNDLSRGSCPAILVKCVVIDEAHKALGNHAYCQVVKQLKTQTNQFRILALSATPGNDLIAVRKVMDNLLISHVELRSDESPEILPFAQQRNIQNIVVPLSRDIIDIQNKYLKVIDYFTSRLFEKRVLYGRDTKAVTKFQVLAARDSFMKHTPDANVNDRGSIIGDLNICVSFYHGYELLLQHGLRCFHSYLLSSLEKEEYSRFKVELQNNSRLREILRILGDKFRPLVCNEPLPESEPWSHPKLEKLKEVVINHFEEFQKSGSDTTRVMIFSQYRESVQEITALLKRYEPIIKPMCFIGHATANKTGFSNKEQIKVMNEFKAGDYNTLICTCIGEEGLDIGEVDLIICFDSHKSPIRMVQRIGRTGRKRSGKVFVLLTEGKEEQSFNQSVYQKNNITKFVNNKDKLVKFLYKHSPRMIPRGIMPILLKQDMLVRSYQDDKAADDIIKAGQKKRKTKIGVKSVKQKKTRKKKPLSDEGTDDEMDEEAPNRITRNKSGARNTDGKKTKKGRTKKPTEEKIDEPTEAKSEKLFIESMKQSRRKYVELSDDDDFALSICKEPVENDANKRGQLEHNGSIEVTEPVGRNECINQLLPEENTMTGLYKKLNEFSINDFIPASILSAPVLNDEDLPIKIVELTEDDLHDIIDGTSVMIRGYASPKCSPLVPKSEVFILPEIPLILPVGTQDSYIISPRSSPSQISSDIVSPTEALSPISLRIDAISPILSHNPRMESPTHAVEHHERTSTPFPKMLQQEILMEPESDTTDRNKNKTVANFDLWDGMMDSDFFPDVAESIQNDASTNQETNIVNKSLYSITQLIDMVPTPQRENRRSVNKTPFKSSTKDVSKQLVANESNSAQANFDLLYDSGDDLFLVAEPDNMMQGSTANQPNVDHENSWNEILDDSDCEIIKEDHDPPNTANDNSWAEILDDGRIIETMQDIGGTNNVTSLKQIEHVNNIIHEHKHSNENSWADEPEDMEPSRKSVITNTVTSQKQMGPANTIPCVNLNDSWCTVLNDNDKVSDNAERSYSTPKNSDYVPKCVTSPSPITTCRLSPTILLHSSSSDEGGTTIPNLMPPSNTTRARRSLHLPLNSKACILPVQSKFSLNRKNEENKIPVKFSTQPLRKCVIFNTPPRSDQRSMPDESPSPLVIARKARSKMVLNSSESDQNISNQDSTILDENVSMEIASRKAKKRKSVDVDSCSDDFVTGETNKFCDIRVPKKIKNVKKAKVASVFIEQEADVSGVNRGSSDESEGDSYNEMDESFICDATQAVTDDLQTAYLKATMRSPAVRKFQKEFDIDTVFSQYPGHNSSYEEDSFCVSDEHVEYDYSRTQETQLLLEAEENLKKRKKKKKKRRIIKPVDDSSSEEEQVISKLKQKETNKFKEPKESPSMLSKNNATKRQSFTMASSNRATFSSHQNCNESIPNDQQKFNNKEIYSNAPASIKVSPVMSTTLFASSGPPSISNSSRTISQSKVTSGSAACITVHDKCTIIAAAHQVASAPLLISLLRGKQMFNVVVRSLDNVDFVISRRVGVCRRVLTDLMPAIALADVIGQLRQFFDKPYLILETPRDKGKQLSSEIPVPQKVLDMTIAALSQTNVRVLHSKGQEQTVTFLNEIAKDEEQQDFGISFPQEPSEELESHLQFYLALPKVNIATAMHLCKVFSHIADFLKSDRRILQEKSGLPNQVVNELWRFVHDI